MAESRRLFDDRLFDGFVVGGELLLKQAFASQREATLYLDFKQEANVTEAVQLEAAGCRLKTGIISLR